jgi:chemotaxis protein CheZ
VINPNKIETDLQKKMLEAKNASPADAKVYQEVRSLADYIRTAKQEIAAIQPKEIGADFIPTAHDELDAVGATEKAANTIMDVCDEISAIAGTCAAGTNEKLVACTTKIYEACNFQDITGQRITKVVTTLKHIDEKVGALLKALGDMGANADGTNAAAAKTAAPQTQADKDKALLNGPQLAGAGVNQNDIDKMFGN